MSVVEEQAKELGVDAAGGVKDGGHERDTMIVSVGVGDVYYWCGGFIETTFRHSLGSGTRQVLHRARRGVRPACPMGTGKGDFS